MGHACIPENLNEKKMTPLPQNQKYLLIDVNKHDGKEVLLAFSF